MMMSELKDFKWMTHEGNTFPAAIKGKLREAHAFMRQQNSGIVDIAISRQAWKNDHEILKKELAEARKIIEDEERTDECHGRIHGFRYCDCWKSKIPNQ